MQSKHTLGPWTAHIKWEQKPGYHGMTHGTICRKNGNRLLGVELSDVIATIPFHRTKDDHDQAEIDARLIAAAPDLLSALQELLRVADAYSDAMREHGHGCHELGSDADSVSASGMARAAIAKAIGPA